jgi:hypothetical protein
MELEKVQRAKELLAYSNIRMKRYLNNLKIWDNLQGSEITEQKILIYEQIEANCRAALRLINYIKNKSNEKY